MTDQRPWRLGWASGDQEKFSIQELIEKFSLDRVEMAWQALFYFKDITFDETANKDFLRPS
jgi:hypothetical protein